MELNSQSSSNESPTTETERAYQLLRRDIIQGRLHSGLKLKVMVLKEQYGIGTAPIREALARLVGDRLVHQYGQRGFHVVETSPEDAEDVGQLRIMLECDALERSIEAGDDIWESGVVAAYHRLSLVESRQPVELEEIEICNRNFHDSIIAACGSKRLLDLRSLVYLHHERYRYLSRSNNSGDQNINSTKNEHAKIYKAVISRDAQSAKKHLASHISRITTRAIDVIMAEK